MTTARRSVFLCAPTFREAAKVSLFLESAKRIDYRPAEIVIVNACPDDATSGLLRRARDAHPLSVTEVAGDPSEFWAKTVNRGLQYILDKANANDWILLTNIDVQFESDIVASLLSAADAIGTGHVGALAESGGYALSSGVVVRSWALGLNRHPFAGCPIGEVPSGTIPVDFLPGRCLLLPVAMVRQVGLMSARLPHYAADYEFSRRLAKHGCPAYVSTDVRIQSDVENTGRSVFDNSTNLRQRLADLWSLKNPANPRFRIEFVRLAYPKYAIPSATLSYLGRSAIEVLLGGAVLRRLFSERERGFSR